MRDGPPPAAQSSLLARLFLGKGRGIAGSPRPCRRDPVARDGPPALLAGVPVQRAPRRRAPRTAACRPPPSRGARAPRARTAWTDPRSPRAIRPRRTRSRRDPRRPGRRPDDDSSAPPRACGPRIVSSRVPSSMSTGCSENTPSVSRCPSCPTSSGRCWIEVAAAQDVQQLEAAADRERRQVALERRLEEPQLAGIAVGLRRVGRRMPLGAVVRRVDVDAAREHDPVEHVERLLDRVLARRHDERPTARLLDRVDVVERHERGRQLPRAPPRRLGVGGDADDRTAVARHDITLAHQG